MQVVLGQGLEFDMKNHILNDFRTSTPLNPMMVPQNVFDHCSETF